jgi:uncharacterized protein YqgC (DUF456 family)
MAHCGLAAAGWSPVPVLAAWWPDWLRWPAWLTWPDWLGWPGGAWWSGLWEGTQQGLVWTVTVLALVVGLVGTVLPMLPGPMLILAAAVWHVVAMRYWLEVPDPGVGWPGFAILGLFVVAAQVIETASSAMGAKYFGSTKWGIWGALAGGLVGLFFGPVGIILGPLLGALGAEMIIAKRELKPAAKSSWGTLIGTVAGLLVKAGLGLAMVGYFFLDVFALAW